jgi:RNA polymerase sigma-70 factor, ECF subfamily
VTHPPESDTTEFAALYRRHAPDVFRFALYLAGERAEAEDLTSETFVRAWTSPEPMRAATVRAYLFTIARNLFLQGLRRRNRQAELPEDVRDPQPGPDACAEQKDELRVVLAAWQRLPEVDRAALAMRAFSDMPYEEIAVALGIPVSTAKVKVHRARLVLAGVRGA